MARAGPALAAPINLPRESLFSFTQMFRTLANKGQCPEISRQSFVAGAPFPPARAGFAAGLAPSAPTPGPRSLWCPGGQGTGME